MSLSFLCSKMKHLLPEALLKKKKKNHGDLAKSALSILNWEHHICGGGVDDNGMWWGGGGGGGERG